MPANTASHHLRDLKESRFELFWQPPVTTTVEGAMRRVGFELEFSGLSLNDATEAVAVAIGGAIKPQTSVENLVVDSELGEFKVEVDWQFLKRKAREQDIDPESTDWIVALRDVATLFVPVEVVCPPIPVDQLSVLRPLTKALRSRGAQGTNASPIAAFGTHVNVEIPLLDAATLHRYLRAYAVLQWWLFDEHDVDTTRKLSTYIGAYPEAYLHEVLSLQEPTMDDLLSSYLNHNPTRNRALDLLPMLAVHDENAVQEVVQDDRVKARPAFHYRLPDCRVDETEWNLARPWNRWCFIECLATDDEALGMLSREFVLEKRGLFGVSKDDWIKRIDQWHQNQ